MARTDPVRRLSVPGGRHRPHANPPRLAAIDSARVAGAPTAPATVSAGDRPGGRRRGPDPLLGAGAPGPRHPPADRGGRASAPPVPPGRLGVPEPRGPAAPSAPRLIPRVHGEDPGLQDPRHPADGHGRAPSGGLPRQGPLPVLLPRRPPLPRGTTRRPRYGSGPGGATGARPPAGPRSPRGPYRARRPRAGPRPVPPPPPRSSRPPRPPAGSPSPAAPRRRR